MENAPLHNPVMFDDVQMFKSIYLIVSREALSEMFVVVGSNNVNS